MRAVTPMRYRHPCAVRVQHGPVVDTGAARSGMTKLSAAVRSRFGPDVVDLSAALDDVTGPVLSDTVHLNERGAEAVAAALYARLEPQLREAAG